MSFKSYTVDGLFAIIETTLTQLSSYLQMNHLSLNILKTKYMIFSNIQHFETNKMPSFGNVVIERVTNLNYLGMIIDEMIPCKDHVRALSIIISRRDGYSKQTKSTLFLMKAPKNFILYSRFFIFRVWMHCLA